MSTCTEARSCEVLKQTLSLGLKGQCACYLFFPGKDSTLKSGKAFTPLSTEIIMEGFNHEKTGPGLNQKSIFRRIHFFNIQTEIYPGNKIRNGRASSSKECPGTSPGLDSTPLGGVKAAKSTLTSTRESLLLAPFFNQF